MFNELFTQLNQLALYPSLGKEKLNFVLDKLTAQLKQHNKYPQPLKGFVAIISMIFGFISTISRWIFSKVSSLINLLVVGMNWAEHQLLNLVTAGQYDDELVVIDLDTELGLLVTEVQGNRRPSLFSALITGLSAVFSGNREINSVLGLFRNTTIETVQGVKAYIFPYGLSKITAVAKAFYHAITQPLEGSFRDQLKSIFIRAGQTLAAFIFIPLSISIETVRYLLATINFLVPSLLFAVNALVLGIFNAPLYYSYGLNKEEENLNVNPNIVNAGNNNPPAINPMLAQLALGLGNGNGTDLVNNARTIIGQNPAVLNQIAGSLFGAPPGGNRALNDNPNVFANGFDYGNNNQYFG